MLPYITLYLLLAAFLEIASRLSDRPLFIRRHSKHFPWKLNFSFKGWGPEEYWVALTQLSVCLVIMLYCWIKTGGDVSRVVAVLALGMVSLSSTILSIRHFKLVQKFKTHAWWTTVLTALATVVLGFVANATADAYILEHTRIDPAQFALGQKALAFLVLVGLWTLIGTLLLSAAVSLASLKIGMCSPSFKSLIKRDLLKAREWKKYVRGLTQRRESRLLITLTAGASLTSQIALQSVMGLLNHADEMLQEALVFTSFHLHPRDCDIPGRGPAERVALIDDGRGVLAYPAKRGYAFEIVNCTVLSIQELERKHQVLRKQDDYY